MAALGNVKPDVVFAALPAYLDVLAGILVRLGYRTFYLNLASSGQSAEAEMQRVAALRSRHVLPLPLESAKHIEGALDSFNDTGHKLEERVCQLASHSILQAFAGLVPGIADASNKLRIGIQTKAAAEVATTGRLNCWARSNPERRHLLIYTGLGGLLAFNLQPNARRLVLPMDVLFAGIAKLPKLLRLKRSVSATNPAQHQVKPRDTVQNQPKGALTNRVAFVVHQGLSYGDLFQKTLYHSTDPESELHPGRLLHLDYSGYPSPSDSLSWIGIGSSGRSPGTTAWHVVSGLVKGAAHIRSASHLLGVLLLARLYASFRFYLGQLAPFANLELALIDYEIHCPMGLLLALDARRIKTVAVQERFSGAFFATKGGAILNTYLCASDYAAALLRKSSAFLADRYLPVGQYRCDNLLEARTLPPPLILLQPKARGRKIITALGFHTHLSWHKSQSDPLLNWSAHRHFLEDMLRLSREIPDVFVILRFKYVNWVNLPIFTDLIREIESSDNVEISREYDKSFFSYDLCANSDLVIAKHTSLGDECLAVGIPVLFHEYTHNTKRLVADAFDYAPTHAMCFCYEDLLARAKSILTCADSEMKADLDYLNGVMYNNLGDGKVRERIHQHIESMLA
jgi:hypothetical protein